MLAREAGVSGLALTDHDTTAGIPRFLAACKKGGLDGVGGVEISVDFSAGTMHLLGYFLDIGYQPLQEALAEIRDGREKRNRRILAKLNELGMELGWDEVAALAEDGVVGRPHFARILVERGYATDTQDAFARWLAKGQAAYFDRFRLPPREGIDLILGAGGVPVLAHPATLGLSARRLRECVAELTRFGLQGIEVFYPMHNRQLVSQFYNLAIDLGLELTGGSDFHGAANPAISIGRGFGNLRISDRLLQCLKKTQSAER